VFPVFLIDKSLVPSTNDRHAAAVILGCKVRRGARLALNVGAALIAITAVSASRAEVVAIDLDPCLVGCVGSTIADAVDAENDSTLDDNPSVFGGGRIADSNDARPDLAFDGKDLPPILASGFPSPMAAAGGQAFDDSGVSPYAFFEDVIDIPPPIDARTGLSASSLLLFRPSLISRLTLTDVLSNSSDLFKRQP
jgi:hypothetical protein